MGNCNKPSQQTIVTPQKRVSLIPQQKGLTFMIKCWKQTHNNLFNFNLQETSTTNQQINIMLKKVRIVKLGQQYQALLPKDNQFQKIMPPIMMDITQLRQKDQLRQKTNPFDKKNTKLQKRNNKLQKIGNRIQKSNHNFEQQNNIFQKRLDNQIKGIGLVQKDLVKYLLHINDFPKISKPFWLVIKSLPHKKYLLKQGDIFKMGKIKLRIKQIIYKQSQTIDVNKDIYKVQYKLYDWNGQECQGIKENGQKCRICMDQGEGDNPLIGLCQCIGSARYAHFKCLRQWFTTQLQSSKINMVTQITWKTLQCQLCKTILPHSINIDNQNYFLVTFPSPKKPYLVLNPVYKANNQKSKIYYFISFKKRNRMIIGRKGDADIQICSDSTLSRHHSAIEYTESTEQNGKFYLSDNSSKFGTVVLLNTKNPIIITPKLNNIQFQVGGDLIKIVYKQDGKEKITIQDDQVDFNSGSNQIDKQQYRQAFDQQDQLDQQLNHEVQSNTDNHSMLNTLEHQKTNTVLITQNNHRFKR